MRPDDRASALAWDLEAIEARHKAADARVRGELRVAEEWNRAAAMCESIAIDIRMRAWVASALVLVVDVAVLALVVAGLLLAAYLAAG